MPATRSLALKNQLTRNAMQSVEDILAESKRQGITSMELCEKIVDGETVNGVKAGLKKNLTPFVKAVREIRVQAKKVS
jgi:hypothetical protein